MFVCLLDFLRYLLAQDLVGDGHNPGGVAAKMCGKILETCVNAKAQQIAEAFKGRLVECWRTPTEFQSPVSWKVKLPSEENMRKIKVLLTSKCNTAVGTRRFARKIPHPHNRDAIKLLCPILHSPIKKAKVSKGLVDWMLH